MRLTNSEPFYNCEHCERLRPTSAMLDVWIKESHYENFQSEMCEDCAESTSCDDEYNIDTSRTWETQRNKLMHAERAYRHAARNEAKYMHSNDTALRRHIIKESGRTFANKMDFKVSSRHKESMVEAINQAIKKLDPIKVRKVFN